MTVSIERYIFLTVAFLFLSITSLDAQKDFTEDADRQFENGAYYSAIELYKKAYSNARKPSVKAEIIYKIAECYRKTNDDEQAEVWYQKAIKAEYDDPMAIYRLGMALKRQGKYEEAISEFKNYKEENGESSMADKAIESCENARDWMNNPSRHELEPQVLINSKKRDFAPTFANRRKNKIIFTSSRDEATGEEKNETYGESFEDLFSAELDREGKWSVPTGVGKTINSEHHEGAACLDSRFRTIYFTRIEFVEKEGLFSEIHKAEKEGRDWGESEVFDAVRPEGDDTSLVAHPTLGFRDQVMVFVSNMEGGQGGKDLWMIVKEGRGTRAEWGDPINLKGVNTEGDEMYPFLRGDGTLYFSSNGHQGMGGLDIFKADMTGDEDEDQYEWGNVRNLKHPMNTPADDFGIVFEGEEEDRGYLSSDREGGRGKDDIYSFRIPPLKFSLIVHSLDKETREPVDSAQVEITGSDGSSVEAMTDQNGMVRFDEQGRRRILEKGNTYSIEVNKEKYLAATGQISTVGYEESRVFNHEAELQPTVVEDERVAIELPEVRYPLDSATLLVNDEVNSKDSLDHLYNIMVDNPNIVIELQAHTDTRASADYNKDLSQRRAETCVEYLISKGVDSARMVPKGYGESQPRISDEEISQMQTQEEKEAAHQKNRRTEFVVLREDYVPDDEGEEEGESGEGDQEDGEDEESEEGASSEEGTREEEEGEGGTEEDGDSR